MWDYCFDSDDCVLFDITFTVLKAGETTVESKIKDMQSLTNNANEYLCKGWEVNDQWDKNIVIKSNPLKQGVKFMDIIAPADGLTTGDFIVKGKLVPSSGNPIEGLKV